MISYFPDEMIPYFQLNIEEFRGLPNGVKEIKMGKRYQAYYIDSKQRERKIGYYKTVAEAHKAWQKKYIELGFEALEEYQYHPYFTEDAGNVVLLKLEQVISDFDAGIITGVKLDG